MMNLISRHVDVRKFGFIVDPRYYFMGWAKSPDILGRKSAIKQLVKAKKLLPKGYNFKIWDCFRPYEVQKKMHDSFRKQLKLQNPKLSAKHLEELVKKFSGGLVKKIERLDTHRNGGSFDLTIVDRNGQELFMGTEHDNLTEKAATDFYESKKKLRILESEVKKNRRLLKKVLTKSGFKNYHAEWWHWSYNK